MSDRFTTLSRSERVLRDVEWLKMMVLHAERAGADRWRRISFLYRVADKFGRRVFPGSFCEEEVRESAGCQTGICCRCRPDVFQYEKEVLDLMPKRLDDSGFCPFFHLTRRTCGIYGVRPFACRIYFNFASSAHYCQNPDDGTLQIFENLKRHLEEILGPYRGGYRAPEA